jgi:hypothetical protein
MALTRMALLAIMLVAPQIRGVILRGKSMTLIETLFAEITVRRDKFSAMCREDSAHEGSREGHAVCGEIDGLYRAMAVTPALTLAAWRVKNAALKDRCCVLHDDEGHDALELTDEIPALLAASLLDDIAAILKDDLALAD